MRRSRPSVGSTVGGRLPEGSIRGAVLVTGAGRGIGRAVALALAAARFPLVLISKSEPSLAETHALCAAQVATRSAVIDVREETQVRRLPALLEDLPELHAVVNNAGVGLWSPIEQLGTEAWDEQVDTNLRGPFLVIRETLRYFRRRRKGLYVNVGSDCSLVGRPERAAYNASKHGLVGLTASLRAECGSQGIHASLVFLGKTDTDFRGHRPGQRPGALSAEQAGELIAFVVTQYPRMVIGEISAFPAGDRGLDGPRSLP